MNINDWGKIMVDLSKLIEGKNLTDVEEKVLRYIIDHIDEVVRMGVRTIAKNNYTSTSTIMRLTKKLGYAGFIDMYYRLLPLVKSVETSKHENVGFINSFYNNSLLQHNNYQQLKKFSSLLNEQKDKFIFVYATGFSAIVAEYIYKKLLVLGKKCILASGMDSVGVFENNLDYIGILLVISRSGETRQVLEKVKTAKENNILTISFTNDSDNSINEITDINFKIEDSNKLDDRNMMPNTFFPNLLMLIEVLVYEYHQVLLEDSKKI
jgi:DNA-binding MurR/RpiR family transcriptional regulator